MKGRRRRSRNFNCRGKKGDGTVGSAKVKGRSRLRDGDEVSSFPDLGKVSIVKG
jgi:hypothetical protein